MQDIKFVDKKMFKKIAEDEGLYYATFDYVEPDTVIDPKLADLLRAAAKTLKYVKEYIGEE